MRWSGLWFGTVMLLLGSVGSLVAAATQEDKVETLQNCRRTVGGKETV